ncbi:MAG: (2Fe-2S)-binding protein [Mesorhizobium sp.]|nr:MAG: (2Fe-2S)-binding protein [Mesorhizobium sp.]
MPKISFLIKDDREITADAAAGQSVMEAAIAASVPGIIAECGGACMCGTCHVHVAAEWISEVGEPGPDEDALLDEAANGRDATSRLACQIRVSGALDGLVVRVGRNSL